MRGSLRLSGPAAALALGAGAAAQTTIYETGFEGPAFRVGDLAGQDDFQTAGSSTATGRVQAGVVHTGAQAAQLDAGGTAPKWYWKDTPFVMGTGGENILVVEWDMLVTAPVAGAGEGYGLDLYSATVNRLIAVLVDDTGELIALLDNQGQVVARSGRFPSDNAWHTYRLVLDFNTGRADVLLDGAGAIDDAAFNLAAGTTFNDADLWALPPGTSGDDVAYYDNLRITADDAVACYADCDTSTGVGNLDIFDFLCFQNEYALGTAYACDCDTSTGVGVCDIFDFLCFQNAFTLGCP